MTRASICVILVLISIACYSQSNEIIYSDPKDTLTNYYCTYQTSKQITGLLLLLPSFGESPEDASKETDIQKIAAEKGLITVFASLQYGTNSFYVDSLSQNALDSLIISLDKKYKIKDKLFYIGGFSLGGAGAVKYMERAYSTDKRIKPKAVFAIDPPLDFERFYNSCEHQLKFSKSSTGSDESGYFIKRLQYEFKGSPQQNKLDYKTISPYMYNDSLQTNIRPLASCPIRLICEPDINWQMENRTRCLYDLNITDCSAMVNSLREMGNKNAVLSITSNKGYRKSTGKRNPHSWSIAESKEIVDWLVQFK